MSFSTGKSSTQLLSVVGPAYVPENHGERTGHLVTETEVEQVRIGVTGLWVAFFAAVIGMTMIGDGHAGNTVTFASVTTAR